MTMTIDDANCAMVAELFARIATTAALPPTRAVVESWRPDVIVRETWEYASTLVADLYDVPVVRVALGLAALDAWSNDLAAPALDVLRDAVGLPAAARARPAAPPPPRGPAGPPAPLLSPMTPAAPGGGDPATDIRRFRQA